MALEDAKGGNRGGAFVGLRPGPESWKAQPAHFIRHSGDEKGHSGDRVPPELSCDRLCPQAIKGPIQPA